MKRYIFLGVSLALVLIQFIPVDRSVPAVDSSLHFFNETNPPEDVRSLLENACIDCHSYDTHYPWYGYLAPSSWFVEDHVEEGREELNFSEWANYEAKRKDHKLEEMGEVLEEGEMPLTSYILLHPEASLNQEQKKMIIDWVSKLRKSPS